MNDGMFDTSIRISLPGAVRKIIGRLEAEGFEAWAVGGCIRDSLLNREPKDWDITTSALPQQIKRIFDRTVDTGIEHGTVTVLLDSGAYETTTYRIDGKYTDSRHPDRVCFSASLEEDLKRRDFTINAMAYSESRGLADLFDGVLDLERHVIRCVGDPMERFKEDALRILRAVRFSAQLDFDIEGSTLEAAGALKERLRLISAERIRAELENLIMSQHPDRLEILVQTGIAEVIFPELHRMHGSDIDGFGSMIRLLKDSPCNRNIRWAILAGMSGSGSGFLRKLKYDNNTIHTVSELLRLEKAQINGLDDIGMRKLIHDAGTELMPLLFRYRMARDPLCDLTAAQEQYGRILENGDCTDIKGLAVNGRDLMEAGIPSGRQIGVVLEGLLEAVIEEPSLNSRETLLARAASIQAFPACRSSLLL